MNGLARASVAAAVVASVLAGCVLVTGGTDGYQLAAPEAGICSGFDASGLAVPVTCACGSSADCKGDGGRHFCCFGLTGTASAGSTCQTTPCDPSTAIQLCQSTAECKGATCTPQTCSYSVVSIPVSACGSLDGCAP